MGHGGLPGKGCFFGETTLGSGICCLHLDRLIYQRVRLRPKLGDQKPGENTLIINRSVTAMRRGS